MFQRCICGSVDLGFDGICDVFVVWVHGGWSLVAFASPWRASSCWGFSLFVGFALCVVASAVDGVGMMSGEVEEGWSWDVLYGWRWRWGGVGNGHRRKQADGCHSIARRVCGCGVHFQLLRVFLLPVSVHFFSRWSVAQLPWDLAAWGKQSKQPGREGRRERNQTFQCLFDF